MEEENRQKAIQRQKWCDKNWPIFRKKRLKINLIIAWKQILNVRKQQEFKIQKQYHMHLQKNAFDKMYGIILNIDEQKNNQAFLFYKKKRLGKILSQWINLLRKVQEKELDLLDYERERRFEIAISKWNTQLMRKEQQRANVLRIQIEKVQAVFEKATEKFVGATYLPIAVLGHLDEDGTKYAVLCFGTLATANADTGVFVVTLYDQSENTKEIKSAAYVNLADFNK